MGPARGAATPHSVVRRAGAALLATLALASACGSDSTITGIVLDVDGDLTNVRSFTLRTGGGDVVDLVPADDGTFEFPLSHLEEHRQTLSPVTVVVERRNGIEVAVSIEDAD